MTQVRAKRERQRLQNRTCSFGRLKFPVALSVGDKMIETTPSGTFIFFRNEVLTLRVARRERVYTARYDIMPEEDGEFHRPQAFRKHNETRLPDHICRHYNILELSFSWLIFQESARYYGDRFKEMRSFGKLEKYVMLCNVVNLNKR